MLALCILLGASRFCLYGTCAVLCASCHHVTPTAVPLDKEGQKRMVRMPASKCACEAKEAERLSAGARIYQGKQAQTQTQTHSEVAKATSPLFDTWPGVAKYCRVLRYILCFYASGTSHCPLALCAPPRVASVSCCGTCSRPCSLNPPSGGDSKPGPEQLRCLGSGICLDSRGDGKGYGARVRGDGRRR